jgi:hypothetical protein
MKANDLKHILDRMSDRQLEESSVEVVVVSQGSMGGTPAVDVKHVGLGIDWDNNRVLISPDKPLIALTEEELKAIKKSVSQAHSYHTYLIVKPLMSQVDELKKFIKSLDQSTLTDEQRTFIENVDKRKAS